MCFDMIRLQMTYFHMKLLATLIGSVFETFRPGQAWFFLRCPYLARILFEFYFSDWLGEKIQGTQKGYFLLGNFS